MVFGSGLGDRERCVRHHVVGGAKLQDKWLRQSQTGHSHSRRTETQRVWGESKKNETTVLCTCVGCVSVLHNQLVCHLQNHKLLEESTEEISINNVEEDITV